MFKGDFWSYETSTKKFVVSPNPEVSVLEFDSSSTHCILLGSDGLWDVVQPQEAVDVINNIYFEARLRYVLS